MWLTPSNSWFVYVVHVLWQIWILSKIGSVCVSILSLEKSHVLEFAQKLIIKTEREKCNASSKVMTWIMQWNLFFFGFWPNFFFTFFKLEIFCICVFWTYQVDFNAFGFGIFVNYKKRFCNIFHGFRPFFFTFHLNPFWVQNRLLEAGI